jgi:hypothetical protein
VDWIKLAQDGQVVSSCEDGSVPSGSIKGWGLLE